jgi:hypothetical protein
MDNGKYEFWAIIIFAILLITVGLIFPCVELVFAGIGIFLILGFNKYMKG